MDLDEALVRLHLGCLLALDEHEAVKVALADESVSGVSR
jgi:hypothetical protein